MADDTDQESRADFHARYEAKREWLTENGFDPTIVHLGGGMFSGFGLGISEAAMCLRCFCLVPIVDLTDATTSIVRHADSH